MAELGKNNSSKELSISTTEEEKRNDELQNTTEHEAVGPGYMGYSNDDQKEPRALSYDEVCQAYVNLMQEFKELKEKYVKLNEAKDDEELKDVRKQAGLEVPHSRFKLGLILVPKQILGSQKNFRSKRNVWVKTNFFVKKSIWFKINFGQKIILGQNNFLGQKEFCKN